MANARWLPVDARRDRQAASSVSAGAPVLLQSFCHGWGIFHILIIRLQAFIFMVLTIVYISMAHDHH